MRQLYPRLSEADAAEMAVLVLRFPGWVIWPFVGYPQRPVWYARRLLSSPPRVLRAPSLDELAAEMAAANAVMASW